MIAPDRRKHPRQRQNFQVKLRKDGHDLSLEGTTVNTSQGGAFIKTKKWRYFKVNDQAIIAVLLPPEYTGQDKTIGLVGSAIIARVDRKNEGIGVAFINDFRQFKPVLEPDLAVNI